MDQTGERGLGLAGGNKLKLGTGIGSIHIHTPPLVSRFIFKHLPCHTYNPTLETETETHFPFHTLWLTSSHLYLPAVWLSPLKPPLSTQKTPVLIMLIATNVMAIFVSASISASPSSFWLKHLFALDISKVITQISCRAPQQQQQEP